MSANVPSPPRRFRAPVTELTVKVIPARVFRSGGLMAAWALCCVFYSLVTAPAAVGVPEGIVTVPVVTGMSSSHPFQMIWEEILREADIAAVMMRIPERRKRRMFAEGRILLDCCADPARHMMAAEKNGQMFTDAFIETSEYYILAAGSDLAVSTPEDLKALRIAAIRGFTYQNEPFFGSRVDVTGWGDMMQVMAVGRADVGIINIEEFRWQMRRRPLPVKLGGLYRQSRLSARVHGSRQDLLARLNMAIARLRARGRIMEILGALTGTDGAVMPRSAPKGMSSPTVPES